MSNKGSLAGLRDACRQEIESRVAGWTDAQKLRAWNHARGVLNQTIDKIKKIKKGVNYEL